MYYVREPIIFPDEKSVQSVLDERVPSVAQDGVFKVCNFCGPFRTHSEGCRTAIKMFEDAHPEYVKPIKLNEWLSSFRCGAIFACAERKSVVVFLSTVSAKEIERTWKPMAEKIWK